MSQLEKYNAFEAQLNDIESTANFLPDVTTKEGYEKSKRIGLDGRKVYNAIDKVRKDLGEDARKMVETINTEGKKHLARIDTSINPHIDAYKSHDVEIKRKKEEADARVTAEINKFSESVSEAQLMGSDAIGDIIGNLKDLSIDFGNRTIEAGHARDKAVNQLTELQASKIMQEAEAKRFEDEKAELEAKQEEDRKAQTIIDEANKIEADKQTEERAKLDEEKRQVDEAERIKNAQEAATKAERDRFEREELEAKAAAEKKSANKAHQSKVEGKIAEVMLSNGFNEKQVETFIRIAKNGSIPHVSINY